MLTRRTHILFDEETARMLEQLALRRDTSVGDLVRRAVQKTYRDTQVKTIDLDKRKKAVKALLDLQKKFRGRFEGMDYRALIEHGRRY